MSGNDYYVPSAEGVKTQEILCGSPTSKTSLEEDRGLIEDICCSRRFHVLGPTLARRLGLRCGYNVRFSKSFHHSMSHHGVVPLVTNARHAVADLEHGGAGFGTKPPVQQKSSPYLLLVVQALVGRASVRSLWQCS